ncbi:hypothetical protein HUW51_17970 [Adhaeribacter swui]|uniref:Uncharacterized protein n=1 Tax=Adhaeribacter swui TaxID=2086471 RepID=A0A7G7GBI6_9BACT|nr:hypothetical protein [Adhaeribacter swui]QNF34520.1 hypothetical protein HUW51_17970 [Adhaeribacter swui]
MDLPELCTNPELVLPAILEHLTGCPLLAMVANPDSSNVRIDWQTFATNTTPWLTDVLRLVLHGKPEIYYLSYTATTANRIPLSEPSKIVAHNLTLQGATLVNSHKLILYCNSSKQIEAGELHVTFIHYQLYDDQFGRINPKNLLLRLKEHNRNQQA